MKSGEIIQKVYKETNDFFASKDKWIDFENTQSIAVGMLTSVFEIVYFLAPCKNSAKQLIEDTLEVHIGFLDHEESEKPRCTKCGNKPEMIPKWTGKENWFEGHCPTCKNDKAEFVGNTKQYYEGDDYEPLELS